MFIYLITAPSGKRYVGQTLGTVDKRWKAHIRQDVKGSCRALGKAIAKYGPKNMKVEILEECSSVEELNAREAYWIEHLGTLSPGGYNLRTGGGNSRMSEETRRKSSVAHKRENLSTETRQRLSEANRRRWSTPEAREAQSKAMKAAQARSKAPREYNGRKPITDETRMRMSAAQRRRWESEDERRKMSEAQAKAAAMNPGKMGPAHEARKKKVACSNGETYESQSAAARALGLKPSHISRVCSGKEKTAGGHTFWLV